MEEQDETQKGIGLREAVRKAIELVTQDLYSDQYLRDVLLEEVERSGDVWLVTVEFQRTPKDTPNIGALFGAQPRTYKRIHIDAQTGEFISMNIRKPSSNPPT